MDELTAKLKWLLLQAESYPVKFFNGVRPVSDPEIEKYLSAYPLWVDDKFAIICSPYPNYTNCRVISDQVGFVCEKVPQKKRVECYDSVTGYIYNAVDSRKIFDVLTQLYTILAKSVIHYFKTRPPTENTGVTKPEVKPEVPPPPTPPKKQKITVPEEIKKLTPTCAKLIEDFGLYYLRDAILSNDKVKINRAFMQAFSEIISADEFLVDREKYNEMLAKCRMELYEVTGK